MKEATHGGVSV